MGFEPRVLPGGRQPDGGGRAPSDADLVAAVLAGLDGGGRATPAAQDAFAGLVRRHEARVLQTLRHLLGDAEDARDVAQDAFLRAFRSLRTFRPDASFRNWLLRIAVNAARDDWHRRGRGRLRAVADIEGEPAAARADEQVARRRVVEQADARVLADQVLALVASLPDREREVFVLREVEGLETSEIAGLLELAEPTVRRHLARARLALRATLERERGETTRMNPPSDEDDRPRD